MKVQKIVKETTNRGEFNRAYKEYLERKGKIHCSYCKYHKNENYKGKWYGAYESADSQGNLIPPDKIKVPNWKLVTKRRKQWMGKPIKISVHNPTPFKSSYYVSVDF